MDLCGGYGFKQHLEVMIDPEKESSCESSPTLVGSVDLETKPDDKLEEEVIFTLAMTFHPSAGLDPSPPDVVFISLDNILFHVHRHRLLQCSSNPFAGLLWYPSEPSPGHIQSVTIDEDAAVMQIALCAIYGLPPETSSFELIARSIGFLKNHGILIGQFLLPHMPLTEQLLNHALFRPIDAYALAAEYDLEAIAVPVSAFLLAHSPSDLTDELASRIGVRYLKRLFDLQYTREEELKGMLFCALEYHPPTSHCGLSNQKIFHNAWALAAAKLAWDAGPDIPASSLQRAMLAIEARLVCTECRNALHARVNSMIKSWSLLDRNI